MSELDIHVVWCTDETFVVPSVPMGIRREDQLMGTKLEQLAELCGRVCYDSLGTGRSSQEFHKHIREVGHLSIWEHGNITVELSVPEYEMGLVLLECINRPGVFVSNERGAFYITLNMRALYEWGMWSRRLNLTHTFVGRKILEHAIRNRWAPQLLDHAMIESGPEADTRVIGRNSFPLIMAENHLWLSVYIGRISRGLSHELVRHGDFTAISQRSTRYCDESDSEWVKHPLLEEYIDKEMVKTAPNGEAIELSIEQIVNNVERLSKGAYREAVERLQAWLRDTKGMDPATARKQARGAARGYLGNGLSTEMIFSASYWQWKNILLQRGSVAADAEIRRLAVALLLEIRKTRAWSYFTSLEIVSHPSAGQIIQLGL